MRKTSGKARRVSGAVLAMLLVSSAKATRLHDIDCLEDSLSPEELIISENPSGSCAMRPCYGYNGNTCINQTAAPACCQNQRFDNRTCCDAGQTCIGPEKAKVVSDCDTIIDTVFVYDAPKYTYKEKIAPVHAGNTLRKLNDYKEKSPTIINKDHCIDVVKAKPIAYPHKTDQGSTTQQQASTNQNRQAVSNQAQLETARANQSKCSRGNLSCQPYVCGQAGQCGIGSCGPICGPSWGRAPCVGPQPQACWGGLPQFGQQGFQGPQVQSCYGSPQVWGGQPYYGPQQQVCQTGFGSRGTWGFQPQMNQWQGFYNPQAFRGCCGPMCGYSAPPQMLNQGWGAPCGYRF